jgi:hypothetical protein
MDTFKIAPTPVLSKITKHPAFQLTMLIFLVFIGMSSYRIYQSKALQDRMAIYKVDHSNPVQAPKPLDTVGMIEEDSLSTTSVNSTVSNSTDDLNNFDSVENSTQINLSDVDKSTATTAAAAPDPSHRSPTSLNNSSLNSVPLKLKVHYIEIPKKIENELKNLATQESNFSENNEAYFGVITNSFSKLNLKGSVVLQQHNPTIENGSSQWFLGSVDPISDSAVGLTSSISNVIEGADLEFSGEINILLTTKEGTDFNGELVKKNIDSRFQLKKGQTFFIGGFFLASANLISGHDWLKGSLMKVLFSRKFQENNSSFVIFFEINEDSQ